MFDIDTLVCTFSSFKWYVNSINAKLYNFDLDSINEWYMCNYMVMICDQLFAN